MRNFPALGPTWTWKTQIIFLIAMLALSLTRAWLSENGSIALTGCSGCLMVPALQHDLALWGAVLAASLLWMVLPPAIAWIAVVIQLSILLLVGTDLFVLSEFGMRLSWRDAVKYAGETGEVLTYLGVRLSTPSGLLKVAMLLAVFTAWIGHLVTARSAGKLAAGTTAAMAATCGALFALPTAAYHPLPWLYRNVVEINLPSGVDRAYSPAFKELVLQTYKPAAPICETGKGMRSNVIVVLVESWSLYHSHARLGVMDATPNLDRLAREGTSWSRFFSNGFTTDHGLIALLGGMTPLPAVNRYHSSQGFAGFENPPDSLPQRLSRAGYRSHFFTTGDLRFMGKDRWLKSLGFDTIEGKENKFYDGAERFVFGAAHDGMLYGRFLEWMSHAAPDQNPYLAVLETVTTHPPFSVPGSDKQDEQMAFQFADAQIANFVETLRTRGFFDNGILLITSDQRALTALRPEEVKTLGNAAPALLPLIALGHPFDTGAIIDSNAQMADIPSSLDWLVTKRSCREPGRGNLFATPPKPPGCIMRPQGNERDILDVYCGQQHLRVRFDGDYTRLVSGRLDDADALILRINAERIRLGERQVEFTMIL